MVVYLNSFQKEVMEYSIALEKILKQYTGLHLEFMKDDFFKSGDDVDLKIGLFKPKKFPPCVDDVFARVVGGVLDILPDKINSKENLDWEVLSSIADDLSMKFIFNSNNEKSHFKNKDFINSLMDIGKKTYEGSPADIGIIYGDTKIFNELKGNYNFEIIAFKEPTSLDKLFRDEKPLLKLVDGKSINLLVEKDFSVYGMAISGFENANLALTLERDFIKKKIHTVHKVIRESLLSRYKEVSMDTADEDKAEIIKSLLSAIEEVNQDYEHENQHHALNFIYFKLNKTILTVYIDELFEISLDNGKWKIKNDYILYYILLWNFVRNAQIDFLGRVYDENIYNRVLNLIEALRILSQKNISSLLVFTKSFDDEKGDLSTNFKEANELLATLPLKKKQSPLNYLEIIKTEKKHKSIENVNMDLFLNLCSVDGAIILDPAFNILSYGEIIDTNLKPINEFGTGTIACKVASENGGLAIKVSEDGDIKVFSDGELILTL